MKKISIFSFTRQAAQLSCHLYRELSKKRYSCVCYTMENFIDRRSPLCPIPGTLRETVKQEFQTDCALIFVSACGIAVRTIAPFIQSKTTDPCVLCIDELGSFVVPLLSGHLGGGNKLAQIIATYLGGTAVISTATDLNQTFAVDLFAKQYDLVIGDLSMAKKISACLLEHIPVGICGLPEHIPLPKGLISISRSESSLHTEYNPHVPLYGIWITPYTSLTASLQNNRLQSPFQETLYLIPKCIFLGIGCKRHTDGGRLFSFVQEFLQKHQIDPRAVAGLASIDRKKDEEGLLFLADVLNLSLLTFSAQELAAIPGTFSSSDFVSSVTGVDNVCERAAMALCGSSGKLLIKKTAANGITIAAAVRPSF